MIRHPPRSTLFPNPTLFRSQLEDIRYIGDLLEPTPPPVDAPAWFREHYGPLDALRSIQQVNESPHFPVVSQVLLSIDRKSTRLNSSHANISYAVFCLKKKK